MSDVVAGPYDAIVAADVVYNPGNRNTQLFIMIPYIMLLLLLLRSRTSSSSLSNRLFRCIIGNT
jgi:hypothetical protein